MVDPVTLFVGVKIGGYLLSKGAAACAAAAHGSTLATLAIAPHMALGGAAANAQLAAWAAAASHSTVGPLAVTHLVPHARGLFSVMYAPASVLSVPQNIGLTYSMTHNTGQPVDRLVLDMLKEFGPKIIRANTNLDEQLRGLSNELLIRLENATTRRLITLPRRVY